MIRAIAVFSILVGFLIAAVSCAKKTPEEKLEDARQALQKQDPLGAIVLANEILRDNTTGPVALKARQLLVSCYVGDRNYREARRVLNDIINSTGIGSTEGQQAAAIKLWTYEVTGPRDLARKQAVRFLEAATTGTTFWAELKLKLAFYLQADEQRSTAARVLDEVFTNKQITSEGIQFQALNQLAGVYGTTETAPLGIKYFQSYLDDSPSTDIVPNVFMVMGHLSRILEKEKQADAYFEKGFEAFARMYDAATGADKKIPILVRYARALSFKGDVDRAAKLLHKGIEDFRSHPNRIELNYELAKLYADNRRSTEAIQVCRDIGEEFHNDPRRISALFMVGDIFLSEKKYDKASEEYKNIGMLYPNTRYARDAYMRMRRVEFMRRRDAQTSAALLFQEKATTPTAASSSPTAETAGLTTPTSPSPPKVSKPTSPTLPGK